MIKKVIYLATGSEFKGFRKGKPGSDQMGAGQTVADIRRSVSSRQAAQQPLLGSTSGSSGGGGGGGGGEAGGGKKNKYIPLVDQGGGDGSGSGSSKGGSNGGEQAPLTNAYLQKLENEAELNETGLSPFPVYHFDKHFAAGMISTSSFSHSLLCQSYFRPFLINTVKLMMNKVVQQSIPPGFEGRKFVELAEYLLENCDGIPIGLYRRVDITTTTTTTTATSTTYGTSFSSSSRKYHHNNAVPLPYVYTNPRWDDEVRKEDHIYVLPN